jgi:hypothetical protein
MFGIGSPDFVARRQTKLQATKLLNENRTDLLRQEVLDKIANNIREYVLKRTEAGLDYDNKPFIEYTEKYAKRKGVSVDEVNLRYSGQMLDEFWVEVKINPDAKLQGKSVWYITLDYLTIYYGFGDVEAEKKYYWNANNQWGRHRDFLGTHYGEELMKPTELINLIDRTIRNDIK